MDSTVQTLVTWATPLQTRALFGKITTVMLRVCAHGIRGAICDAAVSTPDRGDRLAAEENRSICWSLVRRSCAAIAALMDVCYCAVVQQRPSRTARLPMSLSPLLSTNLASGLMIYRRRMVEEMEAQQQREDTARRALVASTTTGNTGNPSSGTTRNEGG